MHISRTLPAKLRQGECSLAAGGDQFAKERRWMSHSVPFLLIPGLACTSRLFEPQMSALWQLGPVMVANHTTADSMNGIARDVLANAPARFNLVALSMGGYISFEIFRQAPERVAKLALLDTASRADLPEQSERRRKLIALAEQGKLIEVNDALWPVLVHESRQREGALRSIVDDMMLTTGAFALIRQLRALIGRPDSRSTLANVRSPTLVIVGESDKLTPPEVNQEIADGIAGARLELVADCGHLSTIERPRAVTKLLVDWFGG
jgi:pimeloyl-ACP methyl ester carboxylesterase